MIPSLCERGMCVKLLQSYLTLCNPMDCSSPGCSVHGILQARILEWIIISFSRGSSWPRDWTQVSYVSCTGRQALYHWRLLGGETVTVSHSVVPELNYSRLRLCFVQSWLLWPHRLEPARLLCPWDSPGKKTQVGCHFLLRGIFPTQGSNPGLLHCRHIQREYCLCQSDSLPTEIEGKPNRLPLFYDKIMLPF